MERRGFLASVAIFLGFGKLASKEQPALPVAKFKDRFLVNGNDLLQGEEYVKVQNSCQVPGTQFLQDLAAAIKHDTRIKKVYFAKFERERLVWVNKEDAIYMFGECHSVWGEMKLMEVVRIWDDLQGSDFVFFETKNTKIVEANYHATGSQPSKELIARLRRM